MTTNVTFADNVDVKMGADFRIVGCGSCNIVYGMPSEFFENCRRERKSWRCPNEECDSTWSYGESAEEKLKKQIEREKRKRLEAEGQLETEKLFSKRLKNQKNAIKGVLTKTKKRIAKGVCPCCNRTFTNSRMARHIATQHPNFLEKK